jgi:hypothetical protein
MEKEEAKLKGLPRELGKIPQSFANDQMKLL